MSFLRHTTSKEYKESTQSDKDDELAGKANTLRGKKKYDFVLKIMKKCNSADIGDVMVYCKNSKSEKIRDVWSNIFRNTSNLQNIIQAAASDLNIQTKATPIYEQIRQKSEYFNMESNRFWDIQKSLDIYEQWCKYHNINMDDFGMKLFEICHKIRPKINGMHITGVSNSGKSYILRPIRNGLMNCGRMRCQASDNFTYGSCIDKTLIYTDEFVVHTTKR